MFSGPDLKWMEDTTPNGWAWSLIGVPAVLGWLAVGICWFLEPRLAVEVSPLAWAVWTVLGWYALLAVLIFGWIALLLILS